MTFEDESSGMDRVYNKHCWVEHVSYDFRNSDWSFGHDYDYDYDYDWTCSSDTCDYGNGLYFDRGLDHT